MRSPVVWLCFGIVVLCALNVESSIKRSYHVIHGQAGPIIRSVVPTVGYTHFGPQIVARRQQRQEEEYEEDYDEEEGEEDEEDDGPPSEYGGPESGFSPPDDYEDEEEDEEEEDEEEGDDEFGQRYDVEGRQAYINNQYVDYVEQPYDYVQRPRPQTNHFPIKTSTKKPPKSKPTKVSSNKKKPSKGNKKKKPKPDPEDLLTNKKEEELIDVGEKVVTVPTPTTTSHHQDSQSHKLQVRPLAISTQFIATPVADLILRLSISLAKPVGNGNATSFSVPIRIHQGAVKTSEEASVINLGAIRPNVELARSSNVSAVTVASVEKHDHQDDADELDEKEETHQVSATELPRK